MQAVGKIAHVEQPESFVFTVENQRELETVIARYPAGRQASAVMPLLSLAQRQCGNWLPKAAMDAVAMMLDMPPIRVYEVATFYSMYNLEPVGRFHVQVCTTTPCWLRGSEQIVDACKSHLGIGLKQTTADGLFSLGEVECLGACVNAPMLQVNDDYYEDLDPQNVVTLLKGFAAGKPPKPGPQSERASSEPSGSTPKGKSPNGGSGTASAAAERGKQGDQAGENPNGPMDSVGKPHVDKKKDANKVTAKSQKSPPTKKKPK